MSSIDFCALVEQECSLSCLLVAMLSSPPPIVFYVVRTSTSKISSEIFVRTGGAGTMNSKKKNEYDYTLIVSKQYREYREVRSFPLVSKMSQIS